MDSKHQNEYQPLVWHPNGSRLEAQDAVNKPRRAIFLDRDGVVVRDVGYLSDIKKLRLLPGSAEAIKKLQEHYLVILVTNQSAVERGKLEASELEHIHQELIERLRKRGAHLDGIYACPHRPGQRCLCRKPRPGMLLRARDEFHLDLASSVMVGDKITDLLAGWRAGVTYTVLINSHQTPASRSRISIPGFMADCSMDSLIDAARWILQGIPGTEPSTVRFIPHLMANLSLFLRLRSYNKGNIVRLFRQLASNLSLLLWSFPFGNESLARFICHLKSNQPRFRLSLSSILFKLSAKEWGTEHYRSAR